MTFEHRRFHKAAAPEKKKEFFGPDGHFTDHGKDEWIYGDISWNSRRKNNPIGKKHLETCDKCKDEIEVLRARDQGGKSNAVPVHDR